MTPRPAAIINEFCYLPYLPFYPAYFGTDVPDLRLALYRIIYNPRTTVRILL